MSSYVSTSSISTVLRQAVLRMQTQMSDASLEASSGNYADTGLTLGSLTGHSLSLQSQTTLLKTVTTTNSVVASRLSTTQTVLGNLQTSAQDMLNSLIAANNTNSGSGLYATTGANDLKDLSASLNTTLDGNYLFAGINTAQKPLTDYFAAGAPNKAEVDSSFATAFGVAQGDDAVSSISGASMADYLDNTFSTMFSGPDWTNNWSSASDQVQSTAISPSHSADTSVSANETAFKQLAQAYTMISQLGGGKLSNDAFQQISSRAQTLLSSAVSGLVDLQSKVGMVQADVTNSNSSMSMQMDILTTQVSDLQSVDPYVASTRVTDLQTQIETAYSLTSQIHKLSLVNYL